MEKTLEQKLNTGLTTDEIKEKTAQGLVNGEPHVKTKSYRQIIKDNIFSLFNLVNVILFICILTVGSLKNAMFFLVVIFNFCIGVVQEVRAKKTIEKLTLLSAPKTTALRNGEFCHIDVKDIVLGEIVRLKNGSQVCADAVVLEGECQVNESFITGETVPISKKVGDHLLSGSFLVSGKVLTEVEHVGTENYVNKITVGAKKYKKSSSVIMKSVKTIVRVIAIAMVPLAGLFIWNNFFRIDQSYADAMVRTVAGISAMIPGGLVLLVSMVLAVSVIRLSVHKTLVQDLYCVENLARVDVLCLDKTGTITEGVMSVERIEPLGDISQDEACNSLRLFVRSMDDENSTLDSLKKYFQAADDINNGISAHEREDCISVPFSSDRKWSMVSFKDQQKALVMGAPEFVSHGEYEKYKKIIDDFASKGKRVLMLCEGSIKGGGKTLPEALKATALIVIGDKIKEDAKATFRFFLDEDVLIKVISGDNPVTVSEVAKEAGIANADLYIDAEELDTYEKIEDSVEKYTVFGRVTPYQKLDIVKALKSHNHTVAMTGDGANDCLALKEADCSIAMQTGAEAARNVANVVMLDSNFASLPLVLAEGRKSINNLQRSAALYLTKTTYAFILALMFVFITFMKYPFENIQITLIGAITIGMPSFFLALEPNSNRIRRKFLTNVFKVAIPTGILTLLGMLATVLLVSEKLSLTTAETSTAATFVSMIMGIIVVFDISGKLNKWKLILVAFLVVAALGLVLLFPSLFSLVILPASAWIIIILVAVIFFIIHFFVFKIIVPKIDEKQMKKEMKIRYGRGE